MSYIRNARRGIVYVAPPTPPSILAGRASRFVAPAVPVWLVQHTAPNRAQRRAAVRMDRLAGAR